MRISKKVFEPVTDTIDITSEHLTEAMMLTSKHGRPFFELEKTQQFYSWYYWKIITGCSKNIPTK